MKALVTLEFVIDTKNYGNCSAIFYGTGLPDMIHTHSETEIKKTIQGKMDQLGLTVSKVNLIGKQAVKDAK